MKKTYSFLAGFALLASAVSISSCTETTVKVGDPNGTVVTPSIPDSIITPNNRTGMRELMKELRSPEIVINIEAGQDEIKLGQRGTIFHFYPYSFKDASGQIITDGFIELKITEVYDMGHMIANRLTTKDNDGKLLDSRGMMYLSATKNGVPVYATKFGVAFKQEESSGSGVHLYHGSYNNADSSTIWTKQADVTGNNVLSTTSLGGIEYYVLDSCDIFGKWMHIASEHSEPQSLTGKFTLMMPVIDFNLSNTEVYAIYEDTRTIVSMDGYNSRVPGFVTDEEIPLERVFNLVVVSHIGNDYYYFRKDDILMSLGLVIPSSPVLVEKHILINNLNVYQ